MNLTSSRIWLMKCMNCAKFFIVLAFMLCSCSLTKAEITSSEVQEIITILNHSLWSNDPTLNPVAEQLLQSQQDLGNGLGYFLTGYGGPDMDATSYTHKGTLPYMLQLHYAALTGGKLNASTPSTWNLRGDTTEIVSLLRRLTNSISASCSSSTSIVNVTTPISPDVLAGNPWWATNSAFVVSAENRVFAFPQDGEFSAGKFSFPEFMSAWSSRLSSPYSRMNAQRLQQRDDWWGVSAFDPNASIADNIMRSYTWFDWIADYAKSNRVSSVAFQADLLRELRALSNALLSASPSVDVTNQTYVFVTNLVSLSAADILAGNPWWATNSNFQFDWQWWNPYVSPWPTEGYPGSSSSTTFPEAFSLLLSSRTRAVYPYWRQKDYWQTFGGTTNSYNVKCMNLYTFEDWLADAFNSNLVLQVASDYAKLTSAVNRAYAGTDVEENVETNSVLASFDDALETPDTSDIEQSFSDTMDEVDSKLRSVSSQFGGEGDPEIVVIPEFTVGGIHVREYRGSLDTSLTRVAHAVCAFLYTVFFICASIRLIRVEWAFWTTLGHSSEA